MKHKFIHHFLAPTLLVAAATPGWSQGITTSAISGVITDKAGSGLPGATVIAVHTPTGTQYVAPTNSEGRFNLQNMRVGGPYTVRITFVGYQDVTREGIYLTLGQTLRLDVNLSEQTQTLADVVVTGRDSRSVLNAERSGATTNISTEEIQRLPTITRNLNDFTRLTPQASSTNQGAIGGGNYRQNNVTIDGADFNNNFGIGGNLPANGNPISLDAVQEISVNLTPYDVRQSGFIGSAVNAVTRSGTNDFSGSVYTYWRNQNQQGNEVGNETFTKQKLDDKQYGFRIGGPVIKNKLFFFLNAERQQTERPGQQNLASTPEARYGAQGTPSNVVRPRATFLDSVSNYLQSRYGYETGPYQNYAFKSDRTNILGRIDWNISNNHHLAVRYSQVESKSPSFVSTSRSPLGNFAQTRTSNFALPFKNSNYYQEANFYSLAVELNSTFGGKFFNTLRGTFTHQNDPRSSDSKVFPFVDILDGTTGGNTPITSFGYEPFTFGNLRDVKSYSIVDFVNYTTGIHNFTLGGQVDLQETKNGFQRFATSYYTFNSYSDFVNGRNPRDFALTYSLLPGYEQAFPRFKFAQYSAYGQDELTLSEKFRLTLGLRAELNAYRDVKEIQTLQKAAELTFEGGRKIDTGILPKNRVLLSPRLGFNYDVKGDRTLQIRGGSGIFAGKVPTVWIVAQSGDAGLLQVTQTWSTLNGGSLPYANMPFSDDPNAYRPATQPTPGAVIPSTLSATDPNFKNPQTWKSSLAVDAQLPWGIVGTLEGIYNKDLITAYGKNYNLAPSAALNTTTNGVVYPDNRPIYPAANSAKFLNPLNTSGLANGNTNANGTPATGPFNSAFNPIVLSNGHKGYYWSVTAKLDKRFSNGLFASVAYVKSQQKVLYDGSGDQLINTWSGTQIVNDPNNPELSYSSFVVPDRVVGSLSYRKEYFGHLGTQVSVFYEGSTQGRFSYTYSNDFNRDGQTNDLIYVPANESEIDFVSGPLATGGASVSAEEQKRLFFQYIEQDDYLKTRRGKYAERNGAKYPWRHQFDVKLAQDLFTNLGDKRNTLQFTLDIFNVGNLLNSDWGVFKTINNSAILVPQNVSSLTPGGTTRPTFRLAADRGNPITSTFRNNNTLTSTYYMQFGLRYIFN
ncbi:carboxypeptidase regulatory-like domain-containing protein [Hymenobacter sp. 15J16-1T3B]|uniref:TonB-dependent receptor n=1 Tax=Hymenobacter sp. 15J16-1T3B TaxID=2886941 RepID=UPI001D104377|nr:carboxypeptidase regulatory-like domain-containing protein [Hymenobacter sp. 15J16-1T3B]MCC3158816.1 carboxypeptidase regulatory-like domain-containing protein [Hymenobacter sp. 15J16-1T3B]